MISDVALKEVGYTESANNANKYSKELNRPAESWCADFVSWCAIKSGEIVLNSASVQAWFEWAKAKNYLVPVATSVKNDLLLFSWNGQQLEHIGINLGYNKNTHLFDTVEGNTSADNTGSQANGDCVSLKHRPPSCIKYAVRPQWRNNK
jgi:hypothetical protein